MPTESVGNAIAAWKVANRRLVWMSSGAWARVLLPSVLDLASRGLLDPEIRAMAVKFATTGIDLEKLADEDLARFDVMRRSLIAKTVLAITAGPVDEDPDKPGYPLGHPDCMIDVELAADDLHDLGQDAGQLRAIVDRATTAEAITLRTRQTRRALADVYAEPPPRVDDPNATDPDDQPAGAEVKADVISFRR